MIYREAGDFKTTYQADSQTFPLRLDRLAFEDGATGALLSEWRPR